MKTANQIAYDKEIKRINRFIKNASKRGFIFNMEAIQEMIPQAGKVITKKKIQTLKEITPNKLYQKATYINPYTGEVTSGYKGRESERKRAAQKGLQTKMKGSDQFPEWEDASTIDSIVEQLLDMLGQTYAPGHGGFTLLYGVLQSYYGGIEDVARAIEPVPEVLDLMYNDVLWESDGSAKQREASSTAIIKIASASGLSDEKVDELKGMVDAKYV